MDGEITVYHWTEKPGEEEVIQGGVVARARFRISPEPGAAAWWERSPGSLTIRVVHSFCVLDPGISAPEFQPLNFTPRKSRRPDPSSLVALVLRAGFLKKISIFSKRATGLTYFSVFVLIIRI